MELRKYWVIFRKWIWLVVLGALLAGGVSFVVSRNMTPVYMTSATLLVSPGSAQSFENYTNVIASERLAQTYARLLTSSPVVEKTYARLQGATAAEDSTGAIEGSGFSAGASPLRDTMLIQLQVTGTDPELITLAANTLIEVFIDWQNQVQHSRYAESKANVEVEMERMQATVQDISDEIGSLLAEGDGVDQGKLTRLENQLSQYRNSYAQLLNNHSAISLAEANAGDTITVVSPARLPSGPISPRVMRNTVMAALVGALVAAGVAFLIEYLDDTVKSPEDLRTADLNVVAAVQRMRSSGKTRESRLFTVDQPKSLVSEAYRTLRTNLQFSSLDRPLHSMVVTSAVATEGKTTTSANLAVVMAQAGKRVIFVDADLRRPSGHKMFGLSNRQGLTTALVEDPHSLNGYLHDSGVEGLQVLTAGPVPPNPQELLGSQRMDELIRALERQADIVVIDTPPVLVVSDANVLSTRTDGVLLVVNTGSTRRTAIQQTVEELRKVGANVLGGVLNMVDSRDGRGYYYYYSYYYSHYYGPEDGDEKPGLRGRLRRLGRRSDGRQAQPSSTRSRN